MIKKNYISGAVFCTLMLIVCAGMVQCMNTFGFITHLQNGCISLEDGVAIAILVMFIAISDDVANTIARMVKALFK